MSESEEIHSRAGKEGGGGGGVGSGKALLCQIELLEHLRSSGPQSYCVDDPDSSGTEDGFWRSPLIATTVLRSFSLTPLVFTKASSLGSSRNQ